jgi:hypothetical protein
VNLGPVRKELGSALDRGGREKNVETNKMPLGKSSRVN